MIAANGMEMGFNSASLLAYFDQLDADRNGQLTITELAGILEDHIQANKPSVRALVSEDIWGLCVQQLVAQEDLDAAPGATVCTTAWSGGAARPSFPKAPSLEWPCPTVPNLGPRCVPCAWPGNCTVFSEEGSINFMGGGSSEPSCVTCSNIAFAAFERWFIAYVAKLAQTFSVCGFDE